MSGENHLGGTDCQILLIKNYPVLTSALRAGAPATRQVFLASVGVRSLFAVVHSTTNSRFYLVGPPQVFLNTKVLRFGYTGCCIKN